MNESKRQLKVANLLREEMADLLQKEMPQLRSGAMITITKVRVSPDLSVARYYLSIFGGQAANILQLFEENEKEIRFRLGNRVRHQLRIVPHLAFHIDDSLDYIDRIDHLLNDKDKS